MSRFRVAFRKTVYGSTGNAREIFQRIVDIDALDRTSARARAIACFCDLEHVTDWLHHADRMEIAQIEAVMAKRPVRGDRAKRLA